MTIFTAAKIIHAIRVWILKLEIAYWEHDDKWRSPDAARVIRAEQMARRAVLYKLASGG